MSKKLEEHIVKTNKVYPLVCENIPYVKEGKTYTGKGVICVLITDSFDWQNGGEGEGVILTGGKAGEKVKYTHKTGPIIMVDDTLGHLGSDLLSVKFPGKGGDYEFRQTLRQGRRLPRFKTLSECDSFREGFGVARVDAVHHHILKNSTKFLKNIRHICHISHITLQFFISA